jgi:hypothetical protein
MLSVLGGLAESELTIANNGVTGRLPLVGLFCGKENLAASAQGVNR